MGVHVLEEEFALQLVTIFLDFSFFISRARWLQNNGDSSLVWPQLDLAVTIPCPSAL